MSNDRKTRPWIHWSSTSYPAYEMGVIMIGRLRIPVFLFVWTWLIVFGVLALIGFWGYFTLDPYVCVTPSDDMKQCLEYNYSGRYAWFDAWAKFMGGTVALVLIVGVIALICVAADNLKQVNSGEQPY